MNLREGFQYMNFLNSKIDEVEMYLYGTDNLMTIKEEHFKSKANKEAEDEVKKIVPDVDFTPMELIEFMGKLIDEKSDLSEAIQKAKNKGENMDHLVSINAAKQKYAKVLRKLVNLKPRESETQASAYMINNEGNQVRYYYDVKKTATINYDRDKVKRMYKAVSEQCKETSTAIDKLQVNTELDFTPQFDISDSIADMITVK